MHLRRLRAKTIVLEQARRVPGQECPARDQVTRVRPPITLIRSRLMHAQPSQWYRPGGLLRDG